MDLATWTWTTESIEQLTLLWDEGVTTAEIGRRIGITKNAVIGKVHRLGLVPRVITVKAAPRRNVFEFSGPVCMWPHGHPGDEDFHFCGGRPSAALPPETTIGRSTMIGFAAMAAIS